MPYVPDPDDATAPLESVLAGTAAAEFRAFKQKVNNFFLEGNYEPELLLQGLKAGTAMILDLPATTNPGILYGHAVNITRNDTNASAVAANGAQLSAIMGNNCNNPSNYVFGFASEAWTSSVNSQAILVGGESSVISQFNDNSCALVGFDIVFKNRPDAFVGGVQSITTLEPAFTYVIKSVGTSDFTLIGASANVIGTFFTATGPGTGTGTAQISVRQGLGANHYNLNSRGLQITAQARSGADEYCGWHKGITFEENSIDYALVGGVVVPGIVIDLSHMGNPANVAGYNNPWVAYRHSSALSLSEYMSITWDKLQQTRTFLDSFNRTMWFLAIGGNSTTPTDVTKCLGYDYTNALLVYTAPAVGGAPGAATGTFVVKVNGVNRNVHFS